MDLTHITLPIITIIILIFFSPTNGSKVDLTMTPFNDKSNRDFIRDISPVVEEIISSWCIFPRMNHLIEAIPALEMRENAEGKPAILPNTEGIFQIEQEQLDYVKKELKGDLLKRLEEKLPKKIIDFKLEDTRKPLLGAVIAACVLYLRSGKPPFLPSNIEQRNEFHENYYRKYTRKEEAYDFHPERKRGKMDVSVLIDGSKSVPSRVFENSVYTVYNIIHNIKDETDRNLYFDARTACYQYSDVLKEEIKFTTVIATGDTYNRINAIKQLEKDVVTNREKVLSDMIEVFKREGRKVEDGVMRLIIFLTTKLDQQELEKLKKVKENLRKEYIALRVVPMGRLSKAEKETIYKLQDNLCEVDLGYRPSPETDNFRYALSDEIVKESLLWIPYEKTIKLTSPTFQGGAVFSIETTTQGVTLTLSYRNLKPSNLEPNLFFYFSDTNLTASKVFYDQTVKLEPGKSMKVFIGENDHSKIYKGAKGTFVGDLSDFEVTIVSAPGRTCETNPCKNGGNCANKDASSYVCNCGKDYKGTSCEIKIDGCMDKPCKNDAKCIPGKSKDAFTCECKDGFFGIKCEGQTTACSKNPCQNGGMCIAGKTKDTYTCECKDGFVGEKCEGQKIKNPCESKVCLKNQICLVDNNAPKCVCKPGYTGENCEKKAESCAEIKCQNGGKCVSKNGKFSCRCLKGYLGVLCELKGGASINPPSFLMSIVLILLVKFIF